MADEEIENPRRAFKVDGMWRKVRAGTSLPRPMSSEYGELTHDWLYSVQPSFLDSQQVGFCAYVCEPITGTPDPSDDLRGRGCYLVALNFATPEEARAAAFGYFFCLKQNPGFPDPHAVYRFQVGHYKLDESQEAR